MLWQPTPGGCKTDNDNNADNDNDTGNYNDTDNHHNNEVNVMAAQTRG